MKCAYTKSNSLVSEQANTDHNANQLEKTLETCAHTKSFCYSFLDYDPNDPFNTSRYRVITSGQCFCFPVFLNSYHCLFSLPPGCWNNIQDSFCLHSQCISRPKPSKALNHTKFCCCYGNMCNSNFSTRLLYSLVDFESGMSIITSNRSIIDPSLPPHSFTVNNVFTEDLHKDYTIFLLLGFAFFFVLTVIVVIYLRCMNTGKSGKSGKAIDSLHLLESQPLSQHPTKPNRASTHNIDDIVLTEIIGKGSYGIVWKGKVNHDTTVAVKVFAETNKRFLNNECRIYSLPFMNHLSLPQFFGCKDILAENGSREYLMAIEYGHLGSLQSYLQDHTIEWSKMCKLIKTFVQGLAYLHTEVFKDSKRKPSIAHRDLRSSNIIVKADETCMICDFQFAIQFNENTNLLIEDLSMVGTVRYMAPEVLEGAINLRQCESSLKQADIYALGLVLWEIASRCIDLYQGIEVPQYKLPFEQEVGLTPTFDQMKVLVTRNKARPLFPDIWKDSNPAIRLLKETIVECWDHEPEARLTALCIEERSLELPHLWSRYKMGTLSNCCMVTSLQQQLKNVHNNCSSNNPLNNTTGCNTSADQLSSQHHNHHKTSLLNEALEAKYSQSNCYINKFENSLHYKYNSRHHLLHHPHHNHLFYQLALRNNRKINSTMEKNFHAAVISGNQPKLTLPLQPHQASNPCIERNLMLDTTDEYAGLLEQGLKFQTKMYKKSNTGAESSQEPNEQEANQTDYAEDRALIRPTLPMPISYVQNPVGGEHHEPHLVKEKDTNKYQNCNHSATLNSFKANFLELIKQKIVRLANFTGSKGKNSKCADCEKAAEPEFNCDTDYPEKDDETSSELAISSISGSNTSITSDSGSTADHSLALNSSSLISPDCDHHHHHHSPPIRSHDTVTQKRFTCEAIHRQQELLNNQIENLDLFLTRNNETTPTSTAAAAEAAAATTTSIKLDSVHETDDIRLDEPQMLHTQLVE